jgi:hypothetical protein
VEDGTHRPAFCIPTSELESLLCLAIVRLFDGVSSARSPMKLSAVINPHDTSSASAPSTWLGNSRVASVRSAKNEAP